VPVAEVMKRTGRTDEVLLVTLSAGLAVAWGIDHWRLEADRAAAVERLSRVEEENTGMRRLFHQAESVYESETGNQLTVEWNGARLTRD
jgi:hypothetical protein